MRFARSTGVSPVAEENDTFSAARQSIEGPFTTVLADEVVFSRLYFNRPRHTGKDHGPKRRPRATEFAFVCMYDFRQFAAIKVL